MNDHSTKNMRGIINVTHKDGEVDASCVLLAIWAAKSKLINPCINKKGMGHNAG